MVVGALFKNRHRVNFSHCSNKKSDYLLVRFVWIGKFYLNKCMGMGAASSCESLKQFSTALEWRGIVDPL